MKKLLILLFFPIIVSCTKSGGKVYPEVDGKPPVITLLNEEMWASLNVNFTIKADISDADGIASVSLICPDMQLNKKIDLLDLKQELINNYNLSYTYMIREDIGETDYEIIVRAEDVGGRTTEAVQKITLGADFSSPYFVSKPDAVVSIILTQSAKYELMFSVADNKALDYVSISAPELSIDKTIDCFGAPYYEYSESLNLPSSEYLYSFELKAADTFGNETSYSFKLQTISGYEVEDYDKMYFTDVKTEDQLTSDIMGIPAVSEKIAPYTYKARYYSAKAHASLYFIPQKTSFTPVRFGIDPEDASVLTWNNPDPVDLPSTGYFEIIIDIKNSTISINKYVPDTTPLPIGEEVDLEIDNPGCGTYFMPYHITLVANGLPGFRWASNSGDGNDPAGSTLQQDPDNPYILYYDFSLTGGTEVLFYFERYVYWENWWAKPYWKWDSDNEVNVLNSGSDMTAAKVPATGSYRIEFDYHLLRTKFYPTE